MKLFISCITLILLSTNCLLSQGFFDYMAENSYKSFEEIKSHLDHYYNIHEHGKGSGYKHYMRWLSDVSSKVNYDGKIINTNAKFLQAYNAHKKSNPAMYDSRSPNGSWRSEGPTDYIQGNGWNGGNGRVNRIALHPTEPNTIFACTPAGGLWRSGNGGTSWICLTDGLPRIGAAGLVIDPNETNRMYLLTGDNDKSNNYSIGLLISTDGGVNWLPSGLSFNESATTTVRKLMMHPTNHDTLYIAADYGLLRSKDRGLTWTNVRNGSIYDIEFQPDNPNRMYASSYGHLFISTDAGTTWTEKADSEFPVTNHRIEIAVTPANDEYVYVLFGSKDGAGKYKGLFRSVDHGLDFTLQSNTPNILGYDIGGNDNLDQGTYDLALSVDPTNEDIVYVGGINIWKSVNEGVSWTIKTMWKFTNNSTGYAHADVHDLVWVSNSLYVASDGGVFRSNDGAENWTNLSQGLAIMQPYDIDVENNIISCGTQDNGSNQWSVGTTVATHTLGADGFGCLINYADNNIRYQSTQDDIRKSTNGGSSFSIINIPNISNYWEVDFLMHPENPDTIYAGVSDIYRSFNGGGSWLDINSTLGNKTVDMALGISNPDWMYAASTEKLVRSIDVNSANPLWTDISLGLPVGSADISCLAVDPDAVSRVWVGFRTFSQNQQLFISENSGLTWQNISGALPNIPIISLISEPGAANGIYAGTDIGVYYRNDNMTDWIYYSTGLPVVQARDLDIDNGRLFVGTFGRGIWSTPLHGGCVSGIILTSADNGSGNQIHQSSDFIASSQIISGTLGTDIQYKAGNEITLTTGFHAMKDNLFHANLDGCQ